MKLIKYTSYGLICTLCVMPLLQGCATNSAADANDSAAAQSELKLPENFALSSAAGNSSTLEWRKFFADPQLEKIIDAALENNQELNILLQEINISRNEVLASSGEYLPIVNLRAGAGTEKVGEYTRAGAVEKNLPIKDGEEFAEPLPDFMVALTVSWEIDIWKKLRNAKKAALLRYLATQEGQNFMVTHLVAEIADSYYELLALDNSQRILERMLELQETALQVVRLQKSAAKATELAVRRFEAEVLNSRSELNDIQQQITVMENRINFLAGRFPQPVERSAVNLEDIALQDMLLGSPSELLVNRPDIRQAELQLAAAQLDVSVARARFYPTFDISAALGYQTSAPGSFLTSPESLLYNLVGDLTLPLFNKRAIDAAYKNATANQLQALYRYQQTVLSAYIEVANQLAMIQNIGASHANKALQAEALAESVVIANSLYKSARADYTEVLLTQRDALESRLELIELRQQQFSAIVNMYQALGGGYDRLVADEG